MKAVALTRYLPITDPESLFNVDLPKPQAAGRDLLVRVEAVSVNPVDTKVRAPKPDVEKTPRVLGWDAAGVVESVGPNVTSFRPGDDVFLPATLLALERTPNTISSMDALWATNRVHSRSLRRLCFL